ncbi:MAG TPA: class I SAM-dependent methyltransferase [Burkholderiaceae bacterium]|nr:class I SAM-dependent methyltransferase [Burkholderiaceae bacterium]
MSGLPGSVDRWNARYSAEGFVFGTEPNDVLAARAGLFAPGDRVLCVADGEGRNSTFLAARGCAVTAFDASPVGVDKARGLAAARGVTVELHVASVDDWDWAGRAPAGGWDAVVAIFVQFATPAQRAAMFEGFGRALRPGGTLLLVGYGPLQLEYRTGGPGIAEHLYDEPMLERAFAGWRIERLMREQRALAEGGGHVGMSDVLELVARRP